VQIPKPTDADKARFESLVSDDPRVEVKPLFGNLGAFVDGNMFMGLFGADIGVKLADADQQKLRRAGGGPFGPEERPMSVTSRCPRHSRKRRPSRGSRNRSTMSAPCHRRKPNPRRSKAYKGHRAAALDPQR
jgi:TfoX/Sxy family transcriptional regulator of competence genes